MERPSMWEKENYTRQAQDCERRLYTAAYALLFDTKDAEAAVFACVRRCWYALHKRGKTPLAEWMLRNVLEIARGMLKKREKGAPLYDAFADSWRQESDMEVRQALAALPERVRLCALLYYFADMTTLEIATMLRQTQGAVRDALTAARTALHAAFGRTGRRLSNTEFEQMVRDARIVPGRGYYEALDKVLLGLPELERPSKKRGILLASAALVICAGLVFGIVAAWPHVQEALLRFAAQQTAVVDLPETSGIWRRPEGQGNEALEADYVHVGLRQAGSHYRFEVVELSFLDGFLYISVTVTGEEGVEGLSMEDCVFRDMRIDGMDIAGERMRATAFAPYYEDDALVFQQSIDLGLDYFPQYARSMLYLGSPDVDTGFSLIFAYDWEEKKASYPADDAERAEWRAEEEDLRAEWMRTQSCYFLLVDNAQTEGETTVRLQYIGFQNEAGLRFECFGGLPLLDECVLTVGGRRAEETLLLQGYDQIGRYDISYALPIRYTALPERFDVLIAIPVLMPDAKKETFTFAVTLDKENGMTEEAAAQNF